MNAAGTPPDLELGRRFLDRRPPPGRLVFCAVSGSHLYGFASANSDLDLKGVHAAPPASLIGLSRPAGSHDVTEIFDGIECDLTTLELGKALGLLLTGNGNVLEQLFSPYQLLPSPWLRELRTLASDSLSKRFFRHYAGFFAGMQREHDRSEAPRAKSLLYSFRVALTGIHLLETCQIEANLVPLAERYHLKGLLGPILELKRSGTEKVTLDPALDRLGREQWPKLEERLQAAFLQSSLPDEPPNRVEIDAWLVAFRLRQLSP